MQKITVQQLSQIDPDEMDLIDVRMPTEFREVHAVGARNVPLDSLNPQAVKDERREHATRPLYVICKSGSRSAMAVKQLTAAGIDQAISVDGGTSAWEAAGLPVVRGAKAISLERQVRILAGFLALTGAVLGFFVHPAWMGLSGFIGAGLMFAGITDTCGMGLMLSKMPWNQCDTGTGACTVDNGRNN